MSESSTDAVAYASLGRRFGAAALDNLVWFVAVLVIVGLVPNDISETLTIALVLILFNAWFNYFWITEWRWGQTIGKRALGVKVTTEAGEGIGWNAAATRNLLRLLDVLVIGPVLIATTRRHQRLGDRAGHSVVVLAGSTAAHTRARAAALANPAAAPMPAAQMPAPPPPGPQPALATAAAGPQPAPAPVPRAAQPTASAPPPRDGVGIPPGSWTPIQVVYGILVLIGLLIVESIVVAAFDPKLKSLAAELTLQALLAISLVGVAIGFARRGGSILSALPKLGLRKFKPSAIGIAFATYVAYVIVALLISPLLHPHQQDVTRDLGFGQSVFGAIAAGVLIVGAAPFSEEMFFRGFIFGGLRRRFPLWAAAVISGVLFGLVHLSAGSVGVGVQLAVFGMLLAWLYEYTGSIWLTMAVHMLNNSLAFIYVVTK